MEVVDSDVTTPITTDKTRIFVGGLGGAVTEDDLRKTFSSLGQVVSVDIVRTKDRSFAYLDFVPSNDKSLPKLFSTYNGCMWKGGRLKLEKAKEHYLLKLKREWQEESELASKASERVNSDASKSQNPLEKPKKPSPADKTQINLFFPKLGKVKSLAQVGIGKHKYSFQRLQVPSNPTHFCDCEEHSIEFPSPSKKQSSEVEDASYGINEQELDIMNSVMNKIFNRANPSKQVTNKSGSVNTKGDPMNYNDDSAAVDDEEDNLTDEDNLVLNVANGKSDSMDLIGEMRSMMANRKPIAKRPITSTEKPKVVRDSNEKKAVPLARKRKSPHSEETNNSIVPETSKNSQIRVDTPKDNKREAESSTKPSGDTSLRSIKSSWKNLLGQKRNTSFNISDFIATVSQKEEEELKDDNKNRKLDSDKNDPGLDINEESTAEVGPVTTEISVPDILANDCPEKQEEPKTNNLETSDVLSDINQQDDEHNVDDIDDVKNSSYEKVEMSDVLPDVINQKEDEPKTDDIDDVKNSTVEKLESSDVLPDAIDQKEEAPRAAVNEVENSNLENCENADSQSGSSNDHKKPTDEDLTRTARGEFWRHKSSWTQLISTTSHTSFSISQIVPNISFEKQEPQADAIGSQPKNKNLDDKTPSVKEPTLSTVKKKPIEKRKKLSIGNLESDNTCSFMRTEESMKEWKKAKASLSTSLNKKKKLVNESA
ncbi:nucleotide-binding alpha-beta plait domain-containing protein [Artemisia annua]|uniref:Nucleotide-binding alpha-beta plait domain-containing protein n=1 Tax=Artemisia annua TaxID=35608 RepID=A0A2U1N4B0_ARTAN|nr:nucleotide-binding alpha-beta plait domain-containing protein [Artemisia annua]